MSARRPSLNTQIVDEAAEWFVTLRHERSEAAVHDRFMAWLRTSPEHVRAYLGIVGLWSDLPGVDSLRESDVQQLAERARATENVASLANSKELDDAGGPVAQGIASPRPGQWWSVRRAVAAAALLSVLALLAVASQLHGRGTYSTGIGEQRILRLADGSKVELNSRSRIRVRYSGGERAVEVIDGQALFEVAKDPRRPFRVRSGSAQMRALGTKFDVYRRRSGTTVTVVEGKVAIGAVSAPEREVVLAAGERIVVTPKAALPPTRTDVSAATAWTQGQLIFRSEPLSSVVEEFNRYNPRRIVLSDEVEDFPVTAVFSSADPRMLVEFLRSQPGLEARSARDEIRIVPSASSP